jgi:hypothetical protein
MQILQLFDSHDADYAPAQLMHWSTTFHKKRAMAALRLQLALQHTHTLETKTNCDLRWACETSTMKHSARDEFSRVKLQIKSYIQN